MRVLFLTCQPPHHMAPPLLSDAQINCGPWFLNRRVGDRWISRSTPYGEFDVQPLIAELPPEQYPDVVVCHVDCGFGLKPRNLRDLRCPVILLAADSHWGDHALSMMVAYAKSEPFTRVVVLYDRHHVEFYRAAGVKDVHWFPGLTFPHGDERVRAAICDSRENQLALVGKTGYHFRRQRLFAALIAAKLPLAWHQLKQADALSLYGRSLIGINVAMNGDLNLRVFETISVGAMLLTDRLSPAAGLDQLLAEGREKVSYTDEREFIDRARHYLSHTDEARAIGDAGRRWFAEHFNEARRRCAFAELVEHGRDLPEFDTPVRSGCWVSIGGDAPSLESTMACYDVVNELHRQQEMVSVQVDETVPEVFSTILATLPRTRIIKGDAISPRTPVDLFVCGSAAFSRLHGGASRLWCWDWPLAQLRVLQARLQPAGWTLARPGVALFAMRRPPIPLAHRLAADARRYLDAGDREGALKLAQQALAASTQAAEAALVLAELAFDLNKQNLVEQALLQAKRAEPDNPRITLLRWELERRPGPWQCARLLAMAWKAYESLDFGAASRYAKQVIAGDPGEADAYYVLGLATARSRPWSIYGPAERALLAAEIAEFRRATERSPERAEYWFALALSLNEAGLLTTAAEAYDRGTDLEPSSGLSGCGLQQLRGGVRKQGRRGEPQVQRTPQEQIQSDRAFALEWARHLLIAGDRDGALSCAESILSSGSTSTAAHVVCGEIVLNGSSHRERALMHFRKAVALCPGDWYLQSRLGQAMIACGDAAGGAGALRHATRMAPRRAGPWIELSRGLNEVGRTAEAVDAALEAIAMAPNSRGGYEAMLDAAKQIKHGSLTRLAMAGIRRLQPRVSAPDQQREGTPAPLDERDLIISHVEINRLQGSGILLQRFFPDRADFVTLRSRTVYEGVVQFGGTHFVLDVPGLPIEQRRARLRLMLSPYRIRRILCVPFFAEDFLHGVLAAEITGAPLAVYTMDDQIIYSSNVPSSLACQLFRAARIRLVISLEMQEAYATRFGLDFEVLPPVVTATSMLAPNRWEHNGGSVNRCAMVGNIWSAKQFEQLRAAIRGSGWTVDWFGNPQVASEPISDSDSRDDGIVACGFLPEPELAQRLATYPFVLVPSGMLDGTEDNEWLTRLSLPSRMVFVLTQTHTPMLVLGSPETAAARFVIGLGVGMCCTYERDSVRGAFRRLTEPTTHRTLRQRAEIVSSAFVMPACGDWIWRSLETGRMEVAPFTDTWLQRAQRNKVETAA